MEPIGVPDRRHFDGLSIQLPVKSGPVERPRACTDYMNTPEAASPRSRLVGLTCLAAIARFHRLELSDQYLLQVASPGRDGRLTAGNIAQTANKIGLAAKVVSLSWRRLGRIGQALPAILILRSGGAIILSGFKENEGKTEAVVRDLGDPTQAGFQFWDRAKLAEVWGGKVIAARRKDPLADPDQPFGLRWFIPEFLRQRRAFSDIVIAALSLHLLALATPIFFQLMIDRVVVHRVQATMMVLTIGVIGAVLFEADGQHRPDDAD